jgi:hypothetical protein
MKILALLLLPGLTVMAADSPSQAASAFYTAYQKIHIYGLPSARELNSLAVHLSGPLQQALRRAQTEQARCIKAHPDEKGPWVDGDLFSSNFEGFSRFQIAESARSPFTVEFEYVERGQKFTWKDQVVMVQENGRWVVDDVRYGGRQAFSNGFGASLRRALSGSGCR